MFFFGSHRFLICSAAIVGCLTPVSFAGEDDLTSLSLEQLMNIKVNTLSRIDERIDEAPGSIYLYDRDAIWNRGYGSLGELLRTTPGFTVFHRDLQYVVGVRGLNANDNEKVSLLINGQNFNGVNEPDFLNGPINLDNAQRVEVVVGPSSIFQQANTLAATINVITRDIEGVDLITSVGNELKYSVTAMAGHRWADDKFISFSATTQERYGFDAWSQNFKPTFSDKEITGELDQPNYFSILRGQYGEITSQFIAYRATAPELNINSGSQLNDGKYENAQYSWFIKAEHPLSKELTAIVTADISLKDQYRNNSGGMPVNGLEQRMEQLVYTTDWSLLFQNKIHRLQAGVQASYDHNFNCFYDMESGGVITPETTLVDEDSYAIGAYADDQIQIADKLKLVVGGRVDRNTRLDSERGYFGGRLGLIYEPSQTWISKLVYNRAVRFPSTIAAMDSAWGKDVPTAPDWAKLTNIATRPEILSTVEWENVFYLGESRLGLTAYYEDLSDFISWYGPHTNVGDFSGYGVEMNLQTPINKNLSLWANASWNRSSMRPFTLGTGPDTGMETQHILTNPNERIIGSPEYTANLGLEYKINKDLIFSPSVRYFTEQAGYSNDENDFITIRNRFYFDAALVWNNAFSNKNMNLRLSVMNMLDNRDDVAGQWIRDTYNPRGITATLTLEYKF